MKTEPDQFAESRVMLSRAAVAAEAYEKFDRTSVDNIVRMVAQKAQQHARDLAEKAVAETGFGRAEDKLAKNEAVSAGFLREYGNLDYVNHRTDDKNKMLLTPKPAGVIFAVAPSTSPVAALIFKVLSALLTRNAIVVSPHPIAKKVCVEAAELLSRAASDAGAPPNLIQVVSEPSVPLIEAMMADGNVKLILATGGAAVVKAAYKSGTPAIGVGPGNPPVIVDETADLDNAAESLVRSKAFDNSVLCTAESVLIVVETVADRLTELLVRAGSHHCSADETAKLRQFMYPSGKFNSKVVGLPAREIAEKAGFRTAEGTRVLLAPIDNVVDAESFTHEKLSPVLAVVRVRDFRTALVKAETLLNIVGIGHSAVIHSTVPQRVLDFSTRLPVHRMTVNTAGSLGNAGIGTGLPVTMSVGTGFVGGSSTGDNLTPEHLVQWKRTAYPSTGAVAFPDFTGLTPSTAPLSGSISGVGDIESLREDLRRIIVEELHSLIGHGNG